MLTRLESQLVGTDEVDSLLPDLAMLVVEGVGLRSARILLGPDPVPAAAYGDRSAPETVLNLCRGEDQVGRVIVTPRPGRRLDARQHRLLADLAAPLTSAAHAAHLTHELRRSRDELRRVTDTERHRLRRDLHDGLGPALAGLDQRGGDPSHCPVPVPVGVQLSDCGVNRWPGLPWRTSEGR